MIETLSPSLRRAVSPYTGIVASVEEYLGATSEPRIFQAACELARSERILGVPLDHLSGIGGAGRDRAGAAAAAVGEAIERYSATYVPRERLVIASARELGDAAVEPERFALFSERQHALPGFPYRPFTRDARVAWVEGRELPSGRSVLVPAELVFLGATSGEEPIGYTTSSGLACSEDGDEAIARGLFELLERDAFMLVWGNRLSLPLLGVDGLDARVASEHALFRRTGLRFAAVDLSMVHSTPIVLGVVRARVGFAGAMGVGAGAAPTIEHAWWKAICEAFATRAAGAKLRLLDPENAAARGDAPVRSFEDHIVHYADHARAGATGFLDASAESTRAELIPPLEGESSAERIAALCRRVEAAGSTAYTVDVTSPDVAELGLRVSRVLSPGLCALDVGHNVRFLGGRRLYEGAAALGLREDVLTESDVNPDPHPFP